MWNWSKIGKFCVYKLYEFSEGKMGANGQEMDYNMDTQMLAKGPVLTMANVK